MTETHLQVLGRLEELARNSARPIVDPIFSRVAEILNSIQSPANVPDPLPARRFNPPPAFMP